MKKTLLAAAVTAAALSTSAIADTKLSGHVNYVGGFIEDFNGNEDLTVETADASESRFRIISTIKAHGVKYGLAQEFGIGNPDRANSLNKRRNELWVKGSAGKVSLGQGSIAGDGALEEDFSGTYVLSGELGSWQFEGIDATDGGDQEGDFSELASRDIGRTERLCYDAPKIGYLALSASINDAESDDEGNDIAVAARYRVKGFAAHLAYINAEEDDSDIIQGSIAAKFKGGFTASLGYHQNEEDNSDEDLEQYRVILGYNPGPYSIAVDYWKTETDDSDITEVESYGVSFVYRPTKGVELYAGVREAENEISNDDGTGILFGGRIKF